MFAMFRSFGMFSALHEFARWISNALHLFEETPSMVIAYRFGTIVNLRANKPLMPRSRDPPII